MHPEIELEQVNPDENLSNNGLNKLKNKSFSFWSNLYIYSSSLDYLLLSGLIQTKDSDYFTWGGQKKTLLANFSHFLNAINYLCIFSVISVR